MRSVIHASRIANVNPADYEARSNLMWTATWALNTLVAKGKTTDWMVHMLGQAVGAYTDATHGMTLAAEGLACMESWMKELGLVMSLKDLGVAEDMIDGLVASTIVMDGGYKALTREEIAGIFQASM